MTSLSKMMKAVTSLALLASALLIVPVGQKSTVQAEGGRQVKAEYLVDESFSFLLTAPDNRQLPSGWDVGLDGGRVRYSYNKYLLMEDTSGQKPVTLYRSFRPWSDGELTLEFRFRTDRVIDGLAWQLREGAKVAVGIQTVEDRLTLQTEAGPVDLGVYEANREYGVKVVADTDTNKATVFVNGALKVSDAAFTSSVEELNGFWTQTGEASTGTVYFSPVKIYKDYTVNETFISTMENIPADWQAQGAAGAVAVEKVASATQPDIYSLKLDGSLANQEASVVKTVNPLTGKQIFEFKSLIPQKTDGFVFELRGNNASALKFTTADGNLAYFDGNGSAVPFYEDYKANLWYAIKAELDLSVNTATIYLNGKQVASKIPVNSTVGASEEIRFSAPAGSGNQVYLDDIRLYAATPLPLDYPSAPQPATPGNYEVGAQSCSMWREGNHLGWDTINPYPERTPLLGFYDDGNPETADWEIKWMVEHGITFEQYCWFRPRGNEGLPIKDPYLGQALHDGYFNSEYKAHKKFTIMWENVNSFLAANGEAARSDFENNLVPYWIEYYFKDPGYLKMDNKPVLSVFRFDKMVESFGSVDAVRTEMDFLRTAVKAAGFDDVIVLSATIGNEVPNMNHYKAGGIDSLYAYTYGTQGSYAGLQKQTMTNQAAAGRGVIDVIATLSMGRNDFAWLGNEAGHWLTPDQFGNLANWAVDTFIPSLPEGSLGKRIVMLDNWNEYGEGHFILPTGWHGFDYLNKIRETFASGGIHEDVVPTEAQKQRFNVLYPADRKVEPVFKKKLVPPITKKYSLKWEFDTDGDSEGWTLTKQIKDLQVSGGSYSGMATDRDPGIMSPDKLELEAFKHSYIEIRMDSSVAANGQIYFITNDDGNWDEAKSVRFYVDQTDGTPAVYHVPMFQSAKWKGQIRQIRFDMMDGPGTFSIDYIRAVKSSNGEIDSVDQVADPGFEAETVSLPGWAVTTQLTTDEYHGGKQSLQITKNDPYGSIRIPLNINKGNTYQYSAWAKLAAGSTPGQKLRIGLQYKVNGELPLKQLNILLGPELSTTGWTQVEGNYTIEEQGTITDVAMVIFTDAPAKAETFYLDDVSVRRVLPPAQDAAIRPESVNYDLHAPADVQTGITWNDAASVTEVVYATTAAGSIYNGALEAGQYTVADGKLTIKQAVFAAWELAKGDHVQFTIEFDRGNESELFVHVIDSKEPEPVAYSITYNPNGATSGVVPVDPGVYKQGVTSTVYGNTGQLAKAGYRFNGWNTKADGSGTGYAEGSLITVGDADVILYAQWAVNQSGGGNGGGVTLPTNPTNPTAPTNPTEPTDSAEEPVQVVLSDLIDHWAEADIKQAIALGLVHGYPNGTFQPDRAVTRAEFVVLLSRALKLEGEGASLAFTDKEQIGKWAKTEVARAVEAGIVVGYDDGSFRPDAQITRDEMAQAIAKAIGAPLISVTKTGFADDDKIANWAKPAIALLKDKGIVEGKGANRFASEDHTTRAEAVRVLLKLLKNRVV